MIDSDESRWRQRLENFQLALAELVDACNKKEYSRLERAGLIQTFEFTFELAWKTLKDLLYHEGFDVKTPRDTLRQAFAAGLLSEEEAETLLDALGKRNLLAHTYREDLAREAEDLIRQHYCSALQTLAKTLQDRVRA